MTDTHMRPGCFGFATTYSDERPECQSCPFSSACSIRSLAARAVLYRKLGIDIDASKRHRQRFSSTRDRAQVLTDNLPKKVQELLDRVASDGVSITTSLAKGENPFVNLRKYGSLAITSHLLMRMKNGFRRQDLCAAFQTKLKVSKATAEPYATVAIQLMIAAGAMVDLDGRYILSPAVREMQAA